MSLVYKVRVSLSVCLIFLSGCSEITDPYQAYDAQQYDQAKQLHLPLAVQSDPKAMTYLAAIYQLEKGFQQASLFYLKAARLNYAPAQYNLAVLLHEGRYLQKDLEQAYAWFYLAGEQKHLKATDQLKSMVIELTPNQMMRAKKWAAEQLDHDGIEMIKI